MSNINKTLYLIRGLPGAGKTSLACAIAWWINPLTREIAADDMPDRYLNSGELNPDISHQEAHAWCLAWVKGWMRHGVIRTICVHNTFAKIKYMQPYLELAEKFGWHVAIVHAEAVRLPDGAIASSVHSVPGDVQQQMLESWDPFRQGVRNDGFPI